MRQISIINNDFDVIFEIVNIIIPLFASLNNCKYIQYFYLIIFLKNGFLIKLKRDGVTTNFVDI